MANAPENTAAGKPAVKLGLIAAILLVIGAIYQFFGVTDIGYDAKRTTTSVFYWLFDRWRTDWNDTWYAHSHLVPLVSLFLLWLRRKELRAAPKSVCAWGLALIILALLAHWIGLKTQQTRLSLLSLVLLSWSIPLYLAGWRTARLLLFPCLFLIFSLPLNFFDSMTNPLRIMAATITAGLLGGLGLEIQRTGSVIYSPVEGGYAFDLADSSGGIFAVILIIIIGLLYAHLTRLRGWRFLALAAMTVPVAMLANVVRGLVMVLLAEALGATTAMPIYRSASGAVLLPCALLLIGLTARLLRIDLRAMLARQKELFSSGMTPPREGPDRL